MDLIPSSPLRAASLLFQPRAGAFALTVVCKATLLLTPGTATLAEEQDELLDGEDHWDDDPKRSLRAPSDLWPLKPRAEVMLVGSVWAPRQVPVKSLRVRLVAGEVDKSIEVFGPRLWTAKGELREGPPWAKMPLRYERAAGGPDTWNPVGVRLDGSPDLYGQKHLPSLQPEGIELVDRGQFLPPVGFGPIASTWPLRRERLGRHSFSRDEPLGDDFDPAFFQDAPVDQQLAALRDDERLELTNLHPEHERLVTRLPGLRPRALLEVGGKRTEIALVADTLWIDTDRQICTLTFRGHTPLADPEAPRRLSIALDEPRIVASPRRLDEPRIVASPRAEITAEVTAMHTPAAAAPLPFVLAGSALSGSVVGAPAVKVAPPVVTVAAMGGDGSETMEIVERPALPSEPGRRSTQEVVVPRGGLAGPAWLSDRAQRPPVPPAPPAPPLAPSLAPSLASPSPVPPAASPPQGVDPAPPALVELFTRPAPLPVPTLASASAAAMAAPAPVLRSSPTSAPARREPSAPLPPLEAFAPVAPLGVAAASDAAAGRGGPRPRPPQADPAPDPRANAPEARAAPSSTLELLWFDPQLITRLRAHPDFAALTRPIPKQAVQPGKPPPAPPTPEAQEKAARSDVYRVISKGNPSSTGAAGSDDLDDPDPPLLLVEGTLSFPFDELGELEAALQLAKPLSLADKKLKEMLDAVGEAQRVGIDAPEVARSMSERIREAWEKANRKLPEDHLSAQIEQRLLEKRQYQKRELLDDEWIRALFSPKSSENAVPTYLPAKLGKRLPLFPRFPVRLLVELYPQQDQREKHHAALKAVAVARVSPRPRIEG